MKPPVRSVHGREISAVLNNFLQSGLFFTRAAVSIGIKGPERKVTQRPLHSIFETMAADRQRMDNE
jgi:hypothetical protein